jgi:hypothetical protein
VGGNFTNNGTWTSGTETLTLTGTSAAHTLLGGAQLYNLTINAPGGTYTLRFDLDVSNNLTITAGTLDTSATSYSISVGGNWSNSGTYTARQAQVTFTGTTAGKTITSGGSSFHTLSLQASGGVYTLQDDTTVSRLLAISAGTLNAGSVTLTLSGGDVAAPFTNSGTFTPASSTVVYSGERVSSHIAVANVTYNNLTFNNSAEQYTLSGTTTVNGNVTIAAGILDATNSNHGLNVGGNFTNAGTFTARGGTVTLTSTSSNATLTSGGSSFWNLTQNGSGGTYTLQDALQVNNNLTMTAGTLDTKSGSHFAVAVSGTFANSGTFVPRLGTFTLDGDDQTISGSTTFYNLTKRP